MAWTMATEHSTIDTKRFFMAHHADFVRCLNVDEMIPFLNKHELLTPDEMEKLCPHVQTCTRGKKIEYLVGIMILKGYGAPSLFIKCVRDAKNHLAHSELADIMSKWLQDHPSRTTTNGSENDTQTIRAPHKSHQRPSNQTQSSAVFSVIDVNVIQPVEREICSFQHDTTTLNTTQDGLIKRTTSDLESQRIKEQALVQTAKLIQERTKKSLADLSTHLPISSHTTRNSDRVVPTGPSTQTPTTKINIFPLAINHFVSARKQRKIEPESKMDISTVSGQSFSEAADQNASLFADTQASKDWFTPFTKLATVSTQTSIFATKGKRSTVNLRTEADTTIWAEEGGGGEGEDPLGTQYEDPPQNKKYKPVLSGDGFIVPRAKPTVETPSLGRFARIARSLNLLSSASPEGMEVGKGSLETHPPIAHNVEVVSLVKSNDKCVSGEGNGRSRNFKKFHKVPNTGGDCLPSFPALVLPSSSELLDCTIDEQRSNRDEDESEEESPWNIF